MYTLNWKAAGAPCLVIGGGHVALRKIRGLLAEGADVTVLAPDAAAEIQDLAAEKKITFLPRRYVPGDEAGYDLVVTACGVRAAAESVHQAMKEKGFLYNGADFPELGNCMIPAKIRRGSLSITLSTEGKSPAFSRYLKEWLASRIPENFGDWLDRVAALREEARHRIGTSEEREQFWRAALSGKAAELACQGRFEEAEEIIRHAMGSFGAQS